MEMYFFGGKITYDISIIIFFIKDIIFYITDKI